MSKFKHLHAILATVHVAIEYDPQDLAALTTLNAQIRDQCRKLTGYRDIEIRLGKIPAPPTIKPTVEEAQILKTTMLREMVDNVAMTLMPDSNLQKVEYKDSLDIPAFMARQK